MLLLPVQAVASKCPDADSVALKWLDKMSRSSYEVSYNGVVTFQRGDDLQVMQVAHTAANGTASESLTQLTGQGAQVVRVDHPLQCIHPGHRLLRLGADMESGDCGISNHYRFSVGEGERIAGRRAVRIEVEPRDMYRYGYIMELDRETGLLLKTQTQGPDRKTLERFQFANLSYTGEAPGAGSAELVHHAHHPVPPTGPTDSLSSGRWKVRWVPEGFTVTDVTEGDSTRKTYTDGLAVFSVFLEQLSRQIKPGEGVVRRGGTTSYTRGMNLSGEYILVTVIGEVPLNTARMVADSVNWAD
jgi:sigma-E factor negative regulatory protein RseB